MDAPQEAEAEQVASLVTGQSGSTVNRNENGHDTEPPRTGPAVSAELRTPGVPLPAADRAYFEPRLGYDLSTVRLHTGDGAAAATKEVGAQAFTYGNDVVLGNGRCLPGNTSGRRLLAHELAHVVQQTSPVIRRQACEDPDETARGALPELLAARGFVGPPNAQVSVEKLTYEQFEAMTGVPAARLQERTFIGTDRLRDLGTKGNVSPWTPDEAIGPASPAALGTSSLPIALAPDNCVGVLGTRPHVSVFAKVNGKVTVVGFRGDIFTHAAADILPGELGMRFKIALNVGVEGAMRGDRLFAMMGEQAVIFRETDAITAQNFASYLREVQYGGEYRFTPPDPNSPQASERVLARRIFRVLGETQAAMCTARNCGTVPLREIQYVLGTTMTRGGVDLTTGRTASGEYSRHEHGRARLMWEYMKDPDLSRGRSNLAFSVMTPAAAKAVGYIRVGGVIMLLYGGYATGRRLWTARDSEEFPLVAAQETLSWTGGILGSAAGAAAVSSMICAPTGPVTMVCTVGGFLGGLLVGAAGATLGALILPVAIRFADATVETMVSLLTGIAMAAEIGRGFVQAFGEALFSGLLEARAALNPCNWDLEGLAPRQKADLLALGFYLWTKIGPASPDQLLGLVGKPVGTYAVPPVLLRDIARGMTQTVRARTAWDIVFTPEFVGGLTAYELAKQLEAYKVLRFRYDPRLLAEIQMLP